MKIPEYVEKESSLDNPIEFFKDFFQSASSHYLSLMIIEGQVEYVEHIDENRDNEIEKLDKPIDYSTLFRNHFMSGMLSLLKKEVQCSLDLTERILIKKDSDESKKSLIRHLISRVNAIIDTEHNIFPPEIESRTKDALITYILTICKTYPYLVNVKDDVYKKLLKKQNDQILTTLCIIPEKQHCIKALYDLLKSDNHIGSETTQETFTKAFTGKYINEDDTFNIRWMVKRKGHYYLGALLIMLNYMVSKGYLYNYTHKQLSHIFVDGKEKNIKIDNWAKRLSDTESMREKADPPIWGDLIDIVDTVMK